MLRMRITQFGFPDDPYGDALTDEGWGCFGNKLTPDACALTDLAKKELGAQPYDWIMITWDDGTFIKRRWEDRAPESDARLDLYMPQGFNPRLPDYASVELVRKATKVQTNGLE